MIDITKFTTRKELFAYLVANKSQLITQKKFEMKKADAVSYSVHSFGDKGEAIKSESMAELLARDTIEVKSVINTTGLLDSHSDVHIPGIWKKTLKEQRNIYLLQEHKMAFDHIISDQVKAYAEQISWKDLGFEFPGSTEALMFDSSIDKARNAFMFDHYAKGYVNNHSVGMRYVQLFLCIDDPDYKEEKANWDNYIDYVVNKSEAEERGYFWAVTQAQLIEGSAVPMGSNWATPTQSVKSSEPPACTHNDTGPATPPKSMFEKLAKLT